MSGNKMYAGCNDIMVVDGIVRWKVSNLVPIPFLLDKWKEEGRDFDYDKSITALLTQESVDCPAFDARRRGVLS